MLPRFECGLFRRIYGLTSPLHRSGSVSRIKEADRSPNPASSPDKSGPGSFNLCGGWGAQELDSYSPNNARL
jgi:hypothetical protein